MARTRYREDWPRKQCQRTVKAEAGFGPWLACVRKSEDLLIETLGWERDTLVHFDRG